MDSRIPLLAKEIAEQRADSHGVPEYMTRLSIFKVLLHQPELARAINDLLGVILFNSQLDSRLRELIIMRLAWSTNSVYEWTQHWNIATSLGVSKDDLLGVRDWNTHQGFGPTEHAVMNAVDETVKDGEVSQSTWDALTEFVSSDPPILLELLSAIGAWRMISSLLKSLRIPLEDGVAPWPPDGKCPAD